MHVSPRWYSSLTIMLTIGAAGCRRDLTAWRAALATPAVQHLAGSWQVDMTVATAGADSGRHVTGSIALTLNEEMLAAPGLDSTPEAFGTYDLDITPFAFAIGNASGVPTVVAALSGDTLRLILAPGSSAPAMLRGAVQGDSVSGRWSVHQRAGPDALGNFVLRHR